jgi:predicted lipoprotein
MMASRPLHALVIGTVVGIAAAGPPALAAAPDLARLDQSAVEHHIEPGYAALARAFESLRGAVEGYCAAPSHAGLEAARSAYAAAMDAWMRIQHIAFGPVQKDNRAFRIEYWPDRKNTTGRQLAVLLKRAETAPPTAESLAAESVAVQGLPALERLLFGSDPAVTGPAGCAVAAAIAGNLDAIGHAVDQGWRDGFAHEFTSPGPDNALYRTPDEATRELFKSLTGALEVIADLKLEPVMEDDLSEAAPHRAESWRSTRSLRNIELNLAALHALFAGDGGYGFAAAAADQPGGAEVVQKVEDGFTEAGKALDRITMPLAQAVEDEKMRTHLAYLLLTVEELEEHIAGQIGPLLGLSEGFNASDGD